MSEVIGEIKVGGKCVRVSSEFTRPANTTAYTVGDMVSADAAATTPNLSFASCASDIAGSGYIVGARVRTDKKDMAAALRLWIFSASDATVVGDNVAGQILWANRAKVVGYIDLPTSGTGADSTNSTGAFAQNFDVRIPFTCGAASQALYGVLEARTAFTPASGQGFYVELAIDQN